MKRFGAVLPILFALSATAILRAQSKTVERTGDVILFALPAVSLGASLFEDRGRGTEQFAKGFVLNQAITFGLKLAINKPRPNMENNNAFPSGHTSTTFQGAAFVQRRYGWKYGIPAYLLAGFTGYSRINADKHDLLDILVGAALGIGCSYLFTTPYQSEHLELTFNTSNNDLLIGLRYRF